MWKLNGITRAAFWNIVLGMIFRIKFLRRLRFLMPAAMAGVTWYLGRRKGASDANQAQVVESTTPQRTRRKAKVQITP